jgi:hypothetical protein
MLDQSSALFLLAEVNNTFQCSDQFSCMNKHSILFAYLKVFLVIHYRPVIEELADIILSADIEIVEAVQHRYGEQVCVDCS